MTLDIDKGGVLDNTPLKFGRLKGKTPTQILDSEIKNDLQYIVWAWETVGNFDVCSHALYRACGGKKGPEGRAQPSKGLVKNRQRSNTADFDTDDVTGTQSSRASSPAKPASNWDDMADDIPF